MKILLVGGTFDLNGGKNSSIISKIDFELNKYNNEVSTFNGGYYEKLKEIIDTAKEYQVIFWMANVPNELEKVRNIKDVNPYAIVIGSKRNDNKYKFVEVLNRSLEQRHNLTIQFSKIEDKLFNMLLFDPLGTSFYDGTSIEKLIEVLNNRLLFLLTTTRKNTYKSDKYIEVEDNEAFFCYTRKTAEIFHKTIEHDKGVTRFLGNSSFISNDRKTVYVTRRDVDKEFIDKDHFVATYIEDDKVFYSKNNDGNFYKPSKDSIVQNKLYKLLPNINYIVHSHCYVENAPFTKTPVPCGALDEIDEVLEVINKYYDNDLTKDYYAINLNGHGCLIFGNNIELLEQTKFITRHLPERLTK